ncbi:PepSY domain-containing protein [Streptomyces sp. NPDC086777]|uniref:PepSY domain-containing protein n=1 Tax=Streptomyces sp. NPDC086777 TaxID=3154866 RepID=UPI00344FD862
MHAFRSSTAGRRRTITAVLAATAVLGGVGAVTAVAVADDGVPDGASSDTVRARHRGGADDSAAGSRHGAVTGTVVDPARAAAAGVASLPGTVTAVELDHHRGLAVWRVEIVTAAHARHELTVDAADATVTGNRPDGADVRGEAALARSARTGLAAAVRTALTRVPGSVTSVEIDDDGGPSAVWQVGIAGTDGTGHEVTVVSGSGKVGAVRTGGELHRHDHSGDGRAEDRGRLGTDDHPTARGADDTGVRHAVPEDRPGRHADEDAPSRPDARDDRSGGGPDDSAPGHRGHDGSDDSTSGHRSHGGSDDASGHGRGRGSDDA